MKYTAIFLSSACAIAIAYFSLAIMLSPAPVAAEYWVREMIVIKRSLVKEYAGHKKIIIASGSSGLFGIDAKQLSKDLKIPVINFGLHAGLPLKTILNEASFGAEKGDIVILPLEPNYYYENGLTAWQIRNEMAWDKPKWINLSIFEKLRAIGMLGPTFMWDLVCARYDERFNPKAIEERLVALDDQAILAKFKTRSIPTSFSYSAFNLDSFGDMERNDGTEYIGFPPRADIGIEFNPDNWALLESFVNKMRNKDIRVYFANAPWVQIPDLDKGKVEATSDIFNNQLSRLAPVLDSRSQLLFGRNLFFNTSLHLNSEGREIRTKLLLNAIRSNVKLIEYIARRP